MGPGRLDQLEWLTWLQKAQETVPQCIRTIINFSCGYNPTGVDSLDLSNVPGLLAIGDEAFADMRVPVTLGAHEYLQLIGPRAFQFATKVGLPLKSAQLHTIDYDAFRAASDVTGLSRLSGLRKIGARSFSLAFGAASPQNQCADLTTMKDLEVIGDTAFMSARHCKFGSSQDLHTIGAGAFRTVKEAGLCGLTGLRTIDDEAFLHARTVEFGNHPDLHTIGVAAFQSADTVDLRGLAGLREVRHAAFQYTPAAKFGEHPELLSIEERAFASVEKETTVSANNKCQLGAQNPNIVLLPLSNRRIPPFY